MIIGSYDLDTVQEVFDVALNINLTLIRLANAKARCRYGHYDYQFLSKSRHFSIVSSDDVDDSKIVKDVHDLSKTTSIIDDVKLLV